MRALHVEFVGPAVLGLLSLAAQLGGWADRDAANYLLFLAALLLAASAAAHALHRKQQPPALSPHAGPAPDSVQNALVSGGGSSYQAAGNITIRAVPSAPTPPSELAGAPHLIWSNVRAFRHGDSYELVVSCDGVTALAVPMFPASWVSSTVDVLGSPIAGTVPVQTRVTQHEEQMSFHEFNAPIQPGRFDLRMWCLERDPIPGEREVRWRVVYMDDDLTNGFITECSARLAFVGIGEPRVLSAALDNTSRKTRNEDYKAFMKEKAAPTTGPRRPH